MKRSCELSQRRMSRCGFTLLELLLSLTLSVALMIAVSTSLFGYYRSRDAGERQVDIARTWLAVTQRFGDDLLQASRTWSESRDRNQPDGVATVIDEGTVRERVLDFGGEFSLTPLVLFGDTQQLTLGTMVPTASLAIPSIDKELLAQQVVVWSSIPRDALQIPYVKKAGLVAFRSLANSTSASEMSFLGIQPQNDRGPVVHRDTLLLGASWRLIERVDYPLEIQAIQFRYYDGQRWSPSWNSQQSQRLPLAIEATFTRSSDMQTLRQVFQIPGADTSQPALSSSASLFVGERMETAR